MRLGRSGVGVAAIQDSKTQIFFLFQRISERGPAKLTEGTDNKRFSKIFANEDTLVIFAPFSPTYFKPALVPSKGGTEMTFFGTGFTDTGSQSIVFTFGKVSQEIPLQYDPKTSTFYCQVPNFDAKRNDIAYPVECEVLISLDGKKFFPYDKKLLVYCKFLLIKLKNWQWRVSSQNLAQLWEEHKQRYTCLCIL